MRGLLLSTELTFFFDLKKNFFFFILNNLKPRTCTHTRARKNIQHALDCDSRLIYCCSTRQCLYSDVCKQHRDNTHLANTFCANGTICRQSLHNWSVCFGSVSLQPVYCFRQQLSNLPRMFFCLVHTDMARHASVFFDLTIKRSNLAVWAGFWKR